MPQIIEWIGEHNKTTSWQVRVERAETGKVNISFGEKMQAVEWLKAFMEKYPSGGTRGKTITFNKRHIYNTKHFTVIRERVSINGCTLEAADIGRCEKMDRCRHYWDCLDMADRRHWFGWRVVP